MIAFNMYQPNAKDQTAGEDDRAELYLFDANFLTEK